MPATRRGALNVRWSNVPPPMVRSRVTLTALSLAASLLACRGAAAPPPPTVIVISLGAVRADELSCYEGDADGTPNIDAFAQVADRYARCVSTSPLRAPSIASMFTGVHPFLHGVGRGAPDSAAGLASYFETLAEALGERGYATGAFVASASALEDGLGQGFQTLESGCGEGTTGRALEWIARAGATGRPCFLFVHLGDARPGSDLAPARVDALAGRDASVGRLLHDARQLGAFDDALVVVTADHGLASGERPRRDVATDIHGELIHVPLLVKQPGQERGVTLAARASGADLPGLVAPVLAGSDAASMENVFPRWPAATLALADAGDEQHLRRAVHSGGLKLIVDSRGDHELYDLDADPGETTDLAAERQADVRRLLRLESVAAGDESIGRGGAR